MTSSIEITPFFERTSNTVQYVVSCLKTNACAVIDPVMDWKEDERKTATITPDALCLFIRDRGYRLEWILETHVHADHVSAAHYIQKKLGGQIAIGEKVKDIQKTAGFTTGDEVDHFDVYFKERDTFSIGDISVIVMETPGHTPACISYYIEDQMIFVGDTIFMPDQGTARCDFPSGSVHDMWSSIQKILSLPSHVKVYTCHDYQPGGREPSWESTVAIQREKNIHVKEGTEKESFVEIRTARDKTLSAPKMMKVAVPANLAPRTFHSQN
ncbi:beta-lactamase [Planoprotostelium fungivorum]|uniref:Beta-lactamase n=1 Tax=Planoprotostelium fungivorum TaxID=1890364 RepID=A0A2P6NB47_9EUKA|nr:beta-lactamase [Planoprotostelium fungivorum]